MRERRVRKIVEGRPALDGAGLEVLRMLDRNDVYDFDPVLRLDVVDSDEPEAYAKGVPEHALRGFELMTYLLDGAYRCVDLEGGALQQQAGDALWITAGRGVLHRMVPRPGGRLRWVHLWMNLRAEDKMCPPQFWMLPAAGAGVRRGGGERLRVLTGSWDGVFGAEPRAGCAALADLALEAGIRKAVEPPEASCVFCLVLEGEILTDGQWARAGQAVLFEGEGRLTLTAPVAGPCRLLLFAGGALAEPVAWGGNVIMNTEEELRQAYTDLDSGRFLL